MTQNSVLSLMSGNNPFNAASDIQAAELTSIRNELRDSRRNITEAKRDLQTFQNDLNGVSTKVTSLQEDMDSMSTIKGNLFLLFI